MEEAGREGAWSLHKAEVPPPGPEGDACCAPAVMQLRRVEGRWPLFLLFGLGGLLPGLVEAPSPAGTPPERSRPYAVLRGQNLALLGSVFSVLLLTMILMAICVYKPLRRR